MEAIYQFDYAILNWMQTNIRSDIMDAIMKAFTFLSEGGIFWIAIAAIMLIPRKTRKYGLAIGAALVLGIIFGNGLLKNAIARLRPYDPAGAYSYLKMNVELIIKTPWDYSFPSGHTLAAFEAATVLTIWKKNINEINCIYPDSLCAIGGNYLFNNNDTCSLVSLKLC